MFTRKLKWTRITRFQRWARFFLRKSSAFTNATMVTFIVTAAIIVAIVGYITISSFGSGGPTTCSSETTSTFSVVENGNSTFVTYPIAGCDHSIALSGFTLAESGSLAGDVSINSHSEITGLILYVNGTYSTFAAIGSYASSMHYSAMLDNQTFPLAAGNEYTIGIVAIFKDKTAATGETVVTVTP